MKVKDHFYHLSLPTRAQEILLKVMNVRNKSHCNEGFFYIICLTDDRAAAHPAAFRRVRAVDVPLRIHVYNHHWSIENHHCLIENHHFSNGKIPVMYKYRRLVVPSAWPLAGSGLA